MKIRKSVVIVDDEPELCTTLKRLFELSRDFDFDVTTAASLDDCRPILSVDPDVLIIDLDLKHHRDPADFQGFLLLLSRSELRDAEIRLVYTVNSTVENAIKALQLGATDFVGKADCSEAELVDRIEKTLHYKEQRLREQQLIRAFILENRVTWRNRLGEYLAIGVDLDNDTAEEVASGPSLLEAIILYDKVRAGCNRSLSHLPHLHFLSGTET